MDDRSFGYTMLTIAIIGWGASSPMIELGLRTGIAAMPFLSYRFILASLILTPYVLIKRHDIFPMFKLPLVWLVGLSESAGLILQYFGQEEQVPPGLASLLSLLFLLIVPFIAPIFLSEKFQPKHLIAVGIALIGVVLISSNGDIVGLFTGNISILGVVLLILAAVGYAFYIVFTSKLRTTDTSVDTFAIFYCVMVIIAISSGIASFISGGFPKPAPQLYLWLILLVIFSSLIAFVTYFEAMKTVSANIASVLLLTQVFVAFFIDLIFLKGHYSLWVLAGSFVILVAMVIAVSIKPETKPQKSAKVLDMSVEVIGG